MHGCHAQEEATFEELRVDNEEKIESDIGLGPGRPLKRLDIDQLEASIERATGLRWVDYSNHSQFQRFRSTLGIPDFFASTKEDLEVSPLFLKFLDDAARSVCANLINQEWRRSESERIFLTEAKKEDTTEQADGRDRIAKNLAYLIERFHGRSLALQAAELQSWLNLWKKAYETSRTNGNNQENAARSAWQAMCVALLVHPDFYTY
ncbi:MAG: hypothetical protein NZM37_03210 [Sandaracinaceae bacterium]|nr:hypothetical protein [Sandaracinaceae bacterium]